ncbi:hypothetical protein Patl1_11562 [Pistacia atlantica]|uniref:Uncharacterized protein n=1 Tax=Pistacia atlantica TaxID=434234 RepID=A0ACC1A7S8_9ROSI|nr:hypothetical protein Patl1_11562 [Pistacia atlantica]
MSRRDIFSWNAILGAQCKAQNLELAYNLFDEMPERNVVSWNNVISALVRKGFEEKALRVYCRMIEEGYVPTHFTLASVLSACAALLDVVQGRRCHGLAVKIGLDKNMYVGNALLCVYAKCGWTRCAVRVFGEMDAPNEVSFTTMMGGLALTDRVVEALEMFRLMCRKGVCIDSVSLSSVLGVCARGSGGNSHGFVESDDGFFSNVHGKQVHCLTIKLGFEGDLHLSNSLLDMYAKNGDMDGAEVVFANLSEVSVVSWNVMIAGYGQRYESKKAIECLKRMQVRGFEPDEVTYINMLAACVKSGDIETGRQMFDSMLIPSVSSWNAMLSGYSQIENHREAIKLFRDMQFRGLQPDRTTLAIILSSCAAMGFLEAGKQIHAASLKTDFHIDNFVASGLIGYSLNSLDREAFMLFKQMQQNGMFPTQFSFATVLSCCANHSGLVDAGVEIFNSMKQGHHLEPKLDHYTCMVDCLGRAGRFHEAEILIDEMPYKDDPVIWEVLLSSCRVHSNVSLAKRAAEELFRLDPKNSATYSLLVNVYSSSGRWDDLRAVRELMNENDVVKDPGYSWIEHNDAM